MQAASVKNEREQGCKSKNYRQKVIVQTQGACTGGQQLPELEKNGMTYGQIWTELKTKKRQSQEFSISNTKNEAFINWYQVACIQSPLPGNAQLWRFEGKWPLRLRDLNTWTPESSTVWKDWRCEVCHWDWALRYQKAHSKSRGSLFLLHGDLDLQLAAPSPALCLPACCHCPVMITD